MEQDAEWWNLQELTFDLCASKISPAASFYPFLCIQDDLGRSVVVASKHKVEFKSNILHKILNEFASNTKSILQIWSVCDFVSAEVAAFWVTCSTNSQAA